LGKANLAMMQQLVGELAAAMITATTTPARFEQFDPVKNRFGGRNSSKIAVAFGASTSTYSTEHLDKKLYRRH